VVGTLSSAKEVPDLRGGGALHPEPGAEMSELQRKLGALDYCQQFSIEFWNEGLNMSLARIAVFFLRLASLCGVLFAGILVVCPLLMPEEIPDPAARLFSPGCFSVFFLFALLPLSLIPAAAAWVIQERNIKPQQDAEKIWHEGALSREERLWIWIRYVADLQIRSRVLRNTDDDPMPSVLQAEIPRALRELDRGRQVRLLRFLREVGWEDAREKINFTTVYEVLDIAPAKRLPRRGPVTLAAGAFALLSGFFLLWGGLALLTFLFANPLQALGMSNGLAELVPGLSAPFILALVCGLACAGLRRLYRQAVRSLEEGKGDQESIQKVVFKSIQDQVEGLVRSTKSGNPENEQLARKMIRAMVAITASELDGLYRAELVQLLYESGWLSGERTLSMEGFDLRAAELGGFSLPEVCLSGADLSGADLSNADLSGADLHRCTLCGSDLRSARLVGANLYGADLRYSRLQKADLERADLRSVFLDGANFWGATMAGAELSGAQGNAEFLTPVVESV
jgi:uncharacterized protein YjbI with pentapeptide repeats